jgi:hypothetical protein
LDFPLETPEFRPLPDDHDAVRAAVRILVVYQRLYLRRSEPHRITFVELSKRTIAWMRAGSEPTAMPYLSREELRSLLRKSNASISDKTIDSILRSIALDLSILGHPREQRSRLRGDYAGINEEVCAAVIDGAKCIVYFAGPTPTDRGEPERQDALFLEPRFRGTAEQHSPAPAVLCFDESLFAEVFWTVRITSATAHARDELRNIFAAIPVNLHASRATVKVVRDSSYLDTFEEVLESDADGRNRPLFAAATLRGDASGASLDGKILLSPYLKAEDIEWALDSLPAELVCRLGFDLQLRLGGGWNVPSVRTLIEESSERITHATIDAIRMRGPILRRDPELGDVVRAGDGAELGARSEWGTIAIVFQRTSALPLWPLIRDYPLARLLTSILKRAKILPLEA